MYQQEVPIGQSLASSPYRVLRDLRSRELSANNSCEAYTGNTVGRKGDVPPLSNSASLEYHAVGDGVNVPEASTKESLWRDS